MKGNKCPYCGRKISYFKTFHNKKKGLYTCEKCKKESKIRTDWRIFIAFAIVVLLALLITLIWVNSDSYNTIWGVVAVAFVFIAFYFCTPLFIRYIPLKKNMSEEKKPSGETFESTIDDDFVFNRDVFDQIKNNRTAARRTINEKEKEERLVPVIKDVSEAHASSSDAPLKKVVRTPSEIPSETPEVDALIEEILEEEDVKTYTPKTKKPNGSRYTANRKL